MKYYIFSLIFILLISPAITALALRRTIGVDDQKENQVLEIFEDNEFTSSFVSPKDHLTSVLLKLKNSEIRNSEPINFSLYSDSEKIREVFFNGVNVGVGSWIRLSFGEITNSMNKTYHFSITSPSSTKENSIGIHTDEKGIPAIITYHKIDSYPTLVLGIYSQFFRKLLMDGPFFILWFSILFFSIILLLPNVDRKLNALNPFRR